MTNSKVHLLSVISFLFVSLVVSDRFTLPGDYKIKRLVPTGPNPEHSPDPPPLTIFNRHDSNINYDIKRLVPSGPNSQHSPDSPPVASNMKFIIKRNVLSGQNSERSPEAPN